MKKLFLIALAAVGMMTANAQALEATNFGSNWSIGLDGGATTHLKGGPFFKDMRGIAGLHIQKQISPAFGVGVEGNVSFNTSVWKMYGGVSGKCIVDNSYVGAYGAVNLMNLFAGYNCAPRVFELEAVAGAGWGHTYGYYTSAGTNANWFATKAGLNFNFNLSKHFTLALKPSVQWNMTYSDVKECSAAYDARKAQFVCMIGATYHFGKGFTCVDPYDADEIAALNAQINNLRAQLDGCMADLAASTAAAAALAAELEACQNRPPKVVTEVKDNMEQVRYVYFANASSALNSSEMRTVSIIADYLKNNPAAKCEIKGYASKPGTAEFNQKLSEARAQAVKAALVKKGIAADRISAEGMGVSTSFTETSWNRVAICTLDK